jgi:hypothetical protein
MGQRTVTDERLVSVHCEELMLGSGKVLRIPCLDCFERQDALPQIAVDHRIIAPVDNCSRTVGWKFAESDIVHRYPCHAPAPAREERSPAQGCSGSASAEGAEVSGALRITSTGQGPWRTTCSATLPKNTRASPVRPCVPMIIRSTPCSLAVSRIVCGGGPERGGSLPGARHVGPALDSPAGGAVPRSPALPDR